MKKRLLWAAVILIIGIGIHNLNDRTSLKKVHNLPYDVQKNVEADLRLQQVYRKDYSYIVFHSPGMVENEMQVEGSMVEILLSASEEKAEHQIQQYTYTLKTSEEHDTIAVFLDGQLIPFDNVVVGN